MVGNKIIIVKKLNRSLQFPCGFVLLRRRVGRVVDCGSLENCWLLKVRGFESPTLRQRKMPPVRDGIFCFKALRIHSHKRENKKCWSRRRQTAAVFFFDSAYLSGDHRSEAEVIPGSIANLFAMRENKKCRGSAKHLRMHPNVSQHWDIALGNARGAEIIQI